MLVLHVSHALQHPSPDRVAQVLSRRLRVNIAQVDGTIDGLSTGSHVHVHIHVHERGAGGGGELLHPHAVEPKVGRGGRGECHVEPGREGRIG